ncbi:hypothetical protein KSD_73650 [Ktedonobacter sp. SOSP1-85]|uniref:ATP-binding protein n=1 Tax=Ktedonobacter sp. SOSP1-85 TaxID=2778367 RepID=UPI001915D3FE|nr:BTAD domain-containing putative transcriptional regulator [Ktedonobacter sp. SOSP1-85]GHO79594.1 hypothetical protein KSD_73650 [Ktedonobacter sp. SOSP1-85]
MLASPTLHIHLLGDFHLVSGETSSLSMSHVPRAQALLVYLLLHRGIPQVRTHLAYVFWPDSTEAQAHSNLRKVLHQLRQALPHADQVLAIDRQTLSWKPMPSISWTLDILEFEQALASAEQAEQTHTMADARQALERAVLLYRGDLFPGCYEEWIFPERDRLHQGFLQAAERLIVLLEQAREYDAALQVAHQLLRHEPLHEGTYRQSMRLHALRGDRSAALRAYHACAKLLDRELGTEPGEATRTLYESLMHTESLSQTSTSVHSAGRTTTRLIGRQAEWKTFQAAWRTAIEEHPHLLMLSGDAGMGKTRLAEEMETWVSRQGLLTASAHCYATLTHLAYMPVTTWLRALAFQRDLASFGSVWLTEIARLLPEILDTRPDVPPPAALTEGWQRQRFFEAITRFILSARQPVLLQLDDLHWCDHETFEWLQYFWRIASQEHARLLLVATVRSEEMHPGHPLMTWLHPFQRDGQVTELSLAPLGLAETTTLAEQFLSHHLTPEVTSKLYRESEGNPLFVVEMVRTGTLETQQPEHEQEASLSGTAQKGPTSSLPPTLRTILAMRLGQLTPLARELVNVAAVIGRTFSFSLLAGVSGEPEETLIHGLDELWRRRIVQEHTDDTYDFSHEKLREAALSELSARRRRFLHRRVADVLNDLAAGNLDAMSSQLAFHYEQANLLEQAIRFYQQAAEAAYRIYDHKETVARCQRALALFSSSEQVQLTLPGHLIASLSELLGDALEVTGKHQEAAEAYHQSLHFVSEQETIWHARLSRKIAATRDYPPHLAEALQAYQHAERLLEQEEDQSGEAWHQEWLQTQLGQLFIFFMQSRVQDMTRTIERVQPLLQADGQVEQRIEFSGYIAMRDAIRDRYMVSNETVALCQQALTMSLDTENPRFIGTAHFNLGYSLFLCGEFAQAETHLLSARTLGEQVGERELVARCHLHFLPLVWRRQGKIESVRELLNQTQLQGERRFAGVLAAHRAWIAWHDGEFQEAKRHGQTAREAWQRQPQAYAFQWTGLWPLMAIVFKQQQLEEAIGLAQALLAPTQQRLPDALSVLLEEVIQLRDKKQQTAVAAYLQRALSSALDMNYL